MFSDTELLDFLISNPDVSFRKQRDGSFVVWDISNGLSSLAHEPTPREALSKAKAAKEGQES